MTFKSKTLYSLIELNNCQKILKIEYNFEIEKFGKLISGAIVYSLTNSVIEFQNKSLCIVIEHSSIEFQPKFFGFSP